MPPNELTLRARYVFPVDGPPLPGGTVSISGARIARVGLSDRQPDWDLGNSAIVPGLVNAHTHLELSSIRRPVDGGGNFTGWLRQIMEARRGMKRGDLAHAIQRGIDSALSAGTTLLGDISTSGQSWTGLAKSGLRATVFCELLGLRMPRAGETAGIARSWLEGMSGAHAASGIGAKDLEGVAGSLDEVEPVDSELGPLPPCHTHALGQRLVPSLSPHAPYSTGVPLYGWAARWGREAKTPICTHLAETPEELQLLEHRSGPLRDFLISIGAWDDSWRPAGSRPLQYLTGPVTSTAHWLIAHGNYLTDSDIASLAAGSAGPRTAVVYCPRTHAYFGHTAHPFRKLLKAGVPVCLGTDSLASTQTLSVLDEARFLYRSELGLPGDVLLRMATLEGARGLGRESDCGSLSPGKFADLAVIRLPDRGEEDPHRLLFDSDQPVMQTIVGGRSLFRRR